MFTEPANTNAEREHEPSSEKLRRVNDV